VGAALDGVDGAGHLVLAVVPEPAGVTETHGLVEGLGGGETDLVVGSGVPKLQEEAVQVNPRHFRMAYQILMYYTTTRHNPLFYTPQCAS